MAELPTAGYGEGIAEPYTARELDVVRPIITRHNRPDNPQRRLLATLDARAAERPQVVVTAGVFEAAVWDASTEHTRLRHIAISDWKVDEAVAVAEALTARLNQEGD